MAYKLIKQKILSGVYDPKDIDKKLEAFLLHDAITTEEYAELKALMVSNPPK